MVTQVLSMSTEKLHGHGYPTEQMHGIQYIDAIYGAVIEEKVIDEMINMNYWNDSWHGEWINLMWQLV